MMPTCPPRAQVLFFAGILTLLQAGPWLPMLLAKISPVAFAAESVAYRYFHSFRLVRGETSIIWEAQGQTLGVLQEIFQYLLDWSDVAALRDRMDLFSYGTLALNSLGFGLVTWCLGRALPSGWRIRLLWGSVSLLSIYGSWWGIFSARLPDYYTYEVTMTVVCLGLFMLRPRHAESPISSGHAIALGALAGAMAGIKITMLPTALLPVLPWLLSETIPTRQLLRGAVIWTVALVTTLAAVMITYYQFDLHHLGQAFQTWRTFVSSPGAEPGFVVSLLNPFAPTNNPWADHRFVPVVVVLWLLAVTTHCLALFLAPSRRRSQLTLVFFVLVTSILHVSALVKRPAETTLFEAGLFLTTLAAALMFNLPARPVFRHLTAGWLSLALGWCLVSGPRAFPSSGTIAQLQQTSRNAWEIHRWLNDMNRPVVVLLPDNSHVSGTVEETLLKGFSDVPTWNITMGYAMLDTIAPRRLFVTQISDAPAGSVLLWTDVPGSPTLVDLTAATPVVLGQIPDQILTWKMQRNEFWPRTVHAAVIPSLPDAALGTVVMSSSTWRDHGSASPLAGFAISPGDAAPRLEWRTEGLKTILRITATKPSSYLAIGGIIPTLPEGADKVRLEGCILVDRIRPTLWQIYDDIDGKGTMEVVVESITARPSDWTNWSIRKLSARYSSNRDSFSVGITQVQPDDWFEISNLTLLVPKSESVQ